MEVFFHDRVADMEGGGVDDDFAFGGGWVFDVDGDGAGDAVCGAADGFEWCVEVEGGVVDFFGVFEVEGLRGGLEVGGGAE